MGRTRTAPAARRAAPPRRVSGPIRPGHPRPVTAVPPRPVPAPVRPQRTTGISDRLKAVPDHRWLDTLLRSRAWIWLLGVALLGIVAMQVSLLSMNAGIGRAVQTTSDLQHANAALSEEVAELSGGERIGALAAKMGLISPAAGDVGYLTVRPGDDPTRAAQNMTAPSAAARARLDGTAVTAPSTTSPAATTTTSSPAATTTPAATTAAPAATATPAPVTTPAATTETPPVSAPVNSTAGAVAAPTG